MPTCQPANVPNALRSAPRRSPDCARLPLTRSKPGRRGRGADQGRYSLDHRRRRDEETKRRGMRHRSAAAQPGTEVQAENESALKRIGKRATQAHWNDSASAGFRADPALECRSRWVMRCQRAVRACAHVTLAAAASTPTARTANHRTCGGVWGTVPVPQRGA